MPLTVPRNTAATPSRKTISCRPTDDDAHCARAFVTPQICTQAKAQQTRTMRVGIDVQPVASRVASTRSGAIAEVSHCVHMTVGPRIGETGWRAEVAPPVHLSRRALLESSSWLSIRGASRTGCNRTLHRRQRVVEGLEGRNQQSFSAGKTWLQPAVGSGSLRPRTRACFRSNCGSVE